MEVGIACGMNHCTDHSDMVHLAPSSPLNNLCHQWRVHSPHDRLILHLCNLEGKGEGGEEGEGGGGG